MAEPQTYSVTVKQGDDVFIVVASGPDEATVTNSVRAQFEGSSVSSIAEGTQGSLPRFRAADTFAGPPDPRINFDRKIRPTIVQGAGALGSVAGFPAGFGGVAAGGALGVGAGSLLADAAERGVESSDFLRGKISTTGRQFTEGPLDPTIRATEEMALDAAFLGVEPVARFMKSPLKTAVRRTIDLGGAVKAEVAERVGVPLGAQNVSKSRVVKGVQKILGNFPFISTPFRKSAQNVEKAVQEQAERMWVTFGPSRAMTELGVDMNRVGKQRFKFIRKHFSNRYDNWFKSARGNGVTAPTNRVQEAFDSFSEARTRGQRQAITGGETRPIPASASEASLFVRKNNNIQPNMTMDQWKEFLNDLDKSMGRAKAKGDGKALKDLWEIKGAVEKTLQDDIPGPMGEAYRQLNDEFSEAMEFFRSPVAKKFGRVDKNAFGPGFEQSGTLNADELFGAAFNEKSPQALRTLRTLIGDDLYGQAVRRHMDDTMAGAVKEVTGGFQTIDTKQVRKAFGIGKPNSAEFHGFTAMLDGTGVRPSKVMDFLDAIDTASSAGFPNVSQFVARRVILGGAKSGARSALPGQDVAQSALSGTALGSSRTAAVAGGLGVSLGMRRLGTVITDPILLREMTQIIKEESAIATGRATRQQVAKAASKSFRRQNVVRLARLLGGVDAAPEPAGDSLTKTIERIGKEAQGRAVNVGNEAIQSIREGR